MPEYIEREKLQKHFENNVTKIEVTVNGQNNFAYLCDHVSHEIRNAPTADVVEVRHGEWLPQRLLGEDVWDCSECKTLGSPLWERCPICGSKNVRKG